MHTLLALTIPAYMLLISPAASAQSPPNTKSPSQPTTASTSTPTDNSESAIRARIALVDAELSEIEAAKTANSPTFSSTLPEWAKQWAGLYSDGTGIGGDRIRITPRSGVAEITEISESTCIAEFTAIGQQGKPVPAPKPGDQIGTRGTVPASAASINQRPASPRDTQK